MSVDSADQRAHEWTPKKLFQEARLVSSVPHWIGRFRMALSRAVGATKGERLSCGMWSKGKVSGGEIFNLAIGNGARK